MFDPKQMMMQAVMGRMTQNPLTQQVLQMKQQGMTPQQALKWVETDMLPYYPIGVYKDRTAAKEAAK